MSTRPSTTRDRIADEAMRLFGDHGYKATTKSAPGPIAAIRAGLVLSIPSR